MLCGDQMGVLAVDAVGEESSCRDRDQTQVFAVLGSYILRKAPDVGSFVALE